MNSTDSEHERKIFIYYLNIIKYDFYRVQQ